MKQALFFSSLLLSVVFILGCSGGDNPAAPVNGDFVYPLHVGNRWQYTITETLSNFNPPIPGMTDSTSTFNSTVETVAIDTIEGSIEVYRFLEQTSRGLKWTALYKNQVDGMYLYEGPFTNSLPKNSKDANSSPRERSLSSDFILQSTFPVLSRKLTPLKILHYPFEIDQQWLVQQVNNPTTIINRIDKKVVGTELVQTPAGKFGCFKIQWLFMDAKGRLLQDIERMDYICPQGLVKRSTFTRNALLWAGAGNEPFGTADRKVEIELMQIQLENLPK
ncbi:MAG: hypothetical protein D6814_07005 [Calditrichaeota bacterium]|nr:MAG: hypothetical protein D6814_07005 [Calditrichota bacterium]